MSLSERVARRAGEKMRKSDRTRERIVSAASRLVLERRGADFQMAEVASACGMTKGALYYYFHDRTALVEEVFDRAVGEFVGRIEGISNADLSPHEALEALCGAFAEEVRQGGTAIVQGQLERARDAGELRIDLDLGLVSSAVCGAFLFAAFRRVREGGECFDPPAFSRELMDLVSLGIVAKG